MKNIQDIYSSKLLPELVKLEVLRKKYRNLIIIIILSIIAVAVTWPSCFIFLQKYPKEFTYINHGIFIVISIYIFTLIDKALTNTYKSQYKNTIIKTLATEINPSFKYDKDNYIKQNIFEKSGIFPTKANVYKGDDFISGIIGKTSIQFSEIHVAKKKRVRTKNGSKQVITPIFDGLFYIADFNKIFNKNTYILTDVAEKLFGFLGSSLQQMNKAHGDLVKLENQEFEKHFAVYSDDQVEARYILSPALMERILTFKKETKKDIQLSFVENSMYVTIPFKEKLFEPKIWRTIISFNDIETFYNHINLSLKLVEILDLNTRIWSKK